MSYLSYKKYNFIHLFNIFFQKIEINIKNYSQKSELYLINTKSNNNNLH